MSCTYVLVCIRGANARSGRGASWFSGGPEAERVHTCMHCTSLHVCTIRTPRRMVNVVCCRGDGRRSYNELSSAMLCIAVWYECRTGQMFRHSVIACKVAMLRISLCGANVGRFCRDRHCVTGPEAR